MALKIVLKPGERVVINGALVRHTGRHTVELQVDTHARVLRGSALMSEDDASSPARRLYFAAQLAYVDEARLSLHQQAFLARFEELADAVRSTEGRQLLDACAIAAAKLDWWQALRAAKDLIAYEDRVFDLQSAS